MLVVQVAIRVFPLPASGLAEHPEIDAPPSTKFTVPVGAEPVTLAVRMTLAPSAAGLTELASVVVVFARAMTCANGALVEGELLAVPA